MVLKPKKKILEHVSIIYQIIIYALGNDLCNEADSLKMDLSHLVWEI